MYSSAYTKEEQVRFMQRAFEIALNGMIQKKEVLLVVLLSKEEK